jgi:RNA polymerase sigma-70 factor (ECF subfamily)
MPDANDPYHPAGALFEQLRPRLTAISRRIVGSEADAEDVVQDCFLKWQGAEQGALQSPAAWLTTVVQHGSIDVLRRRARESAAFGTVASDTALQLAPDTPTAPPEDALLRRADLAEALARMLACLSPSERLALVLREAFDCEHADIAAVLGTSPVNARQHLARARRRLREAGPEDAPPNEKLCRELVRRFQAAINGMDVAAMVTLLAHEQPVSVLDPARVRALAKDGACANDGVYALPLAA